MKRLFFISSTGKKKVGTAILCCALILTMGVGCSTTTCEEVSVLPESVSVTYNELTITVDARMELLSIVQYVGNNHNVDYGLMSQFFTDYKYDIDGHFRDFDKHPAVKFHDEITAENFPVDEPPTIILFMNPDFSLDKEAFREYLSMMNKENLNFTDEETVELFFGLLKEFCTQTGFNKFYNDHKKYYDTIIANTQAALPKDNILGYMEEFYGKSMNSYNLLPTTLFHSGGFGPSITREGKTDIYAILGPSGVIDRVPDFRSAEELLELEAHEFGHSFIDISNETSSPFADLIKQSEYLQKAIYDNMSKQGYGAWESALEETVLRACVIKQLEHFNPIVAPNLLQQERDTGFMYIDTVYNCLDDYLAHRDIYPEFNLYIPQIIAMLMEQTDFTEN